MLDEDDMIINSTQFLWMSKSVSFADSIGSLDDGITYVMACARHRKEWGRAPAKMYHDRHEARDIGQGHPIWSEDYREEQKIIQFIWDHHLMASLWQLGTKSMARP
jgi:hypothetical protein